MIGELFAVGTELLDGDVVNLNTAYLAKECHKLGIELRAHHILGDDEEDLIDAFLEAYQESEIIIISGGLGPTYDDMTREAIAKALGKKLMIDEKGKQAIDTFFLKNQLKQTPNNIRQAYILEGAQALQNEVGLAVGSYLEHEGKVVILLPGPPHEMRWVFEHEVLCKLKNNQVEIQERFLHFFGIGEAELEDRLYTLMTETKNPRIAPYAKGDMVTVKLTARSNGEDDIQMLLKKTEEAILKILTEVPYQKGDENSISWLAGDLIKKNKTLTLAESCTGGMLSSLLTSFDGVSKVYKGCFCTYDVELKKSILGVRKDTLKKHTVYSEQVAMEMAQGAKRLSKADYAIATTGIVGESEDGVPRGKVFYAFVSNERVYSSSYQVYAGQYKDRAVLQETMARKLLVLFYHWQREES